MPDMPANLNKSIDLFEKTYLRGETMRLAVGGKGYFLGVTTRHQLTPEQRSAGAKVWQPPRPERTLTEDQCRHIAATAMNEQHAASRLAATLINGEPFDDGSANRTLPVDVQRIVQQAVELELQRRMAQVPKEVVERVETAAVERAVVAEVTASDAALAEMIADKGWTPLSGKAKPKTARQKARQDKNYRITRQAEWRQKAKELYESGDKKYINWETMRFYGFTANALERRHGEYLTHKNVMAKIKPDPVLPVIDTPSALPSA